MQVPDDRKRAAIIEAATRLFAGRSYHEARLADVAAAAALVRRFARRALERR